MWKRVEGSDEHIMIPKVIGIIVGMLAGGIYAWKLKECRRAVHESSYRWVNAIYGFSITSPPIFQKMEISQHK